MSVVQSADELDLAEIKQTAVSPTQDAQEAEVDVPLDPEMVKQTEKQALATFTDGNFVDQSNPEQSQAEVALAS